MHSVARCARPGERRDGRAEHQREHDRDEDDAAHDERAERTPDRRLHVVSRIGIGCSRAQHRACAA